MCVLLIGWKLREWPHVVVAANRDEARQRPSLPPQHMSCGTHRALLPVDRLAGGTWLGVNDAGVAVALTNRAERTFDASRPSRGELARRALACGSAAEVHRELERQLAENEFNGFNLFCADGNDAWVATWKGRLHTSTLQSGVHVLTNSHDLDELPVPEFARLRWRHDEWPTLQRRLQRLLGDHTPRDGDATPLCKHGDVYGTVSAAVFFPRRQGGWHMDFAAGNPCTTPFLRYQLAGDATDSEEPPLPGA